MDVATFWDLIDRTREASGGDIRRQAKFMIEELISLSVEEILAYELVMDNLMDSAYDAALWDAASIINCGCSDDGFEDFRAWLIAQGKEVYEKALIDPESLVDLIEVNERADDGFILYVFTKAYGHMTGSEIHIKYREQPLLKGEHWDEDVRNSRFPKLDAKFGNCDQRDSIWFAEEARPPDEYDF